MTLQRTDSALVGLAGFEPATPWPPELCATHHPRKQQHPGAESLLPSPRFRTFRRCSGDHHVPTWSRRSPHPVLPPAPTPADSCSRESAAGMT